MTDKTVLITGCSSGIGEATAKHFVENDWTVYATARDTTDLTDLWNLGCETKELDVTRHQQVYSVLNTIKSEQGQLDCLVNNAGYGQFGPVEDISTGDLRKQFDTNLFGVHRLIREALPLLRESNGTIVNLSSIVGAVWLPGAGAYSASKAALEALSDALRVELQPFDVNVVLIEPGPVTTNFDNTRTDKMAGLTPTPGYEAVYAFHTNNHDSNRLVTPSKPTDVANAIYRAAIGKTGARVTVGRGTATSMALAKLLPTRVRDWLFSRLLNKN